MRDLLRAIGPQAGYGADALLGKLQDREAQGSTFLNEGLALPHARIEGLDRPQLALGISHGGIPDAGAANPIEAVLLLLSPKDGHRTHLQLLAVAGRMMLSRTLRNWLRKERGAEGVYAALKELENPA